MKTIYYDAIVMPICLKGSYACLNISFLFHVANVLISERTWWNFQLISLEYTYLYCQNMICFLGDMILGPVWDHFTLWILCSDWNWREDWWAQCMSIKCRWPDYWWRSWWTSKGCRPGSGISISVILFGEGGIGTHFFEQGILVSTIEPNAQVQFI